MEQITYTVIRSDRKTIQLQLTKELEVLVRAPRTMAKRDIHSFVQSHADWVEQARPKVAAWYAAHPEPSQEERQACIRRAKEYLPGRLAYYAPQMGVHYEKVTITSARTRYGSCSARGNLCFSWRLMAYPDTVVDALVVHELAHLKHMNHQKAFYDEIEKVMPDYRERIKLLRTLQKENAAG